MVAVARSDQVGPAGSDQRSGLLSPLITSALVVVPVAHGGLTGWAGLRESGDLQAAVNQHHPTWSPLAHRRRAASLPPAPQHDLVSDTRSQSLVRRHRKPSTTFSTR
jgi:hypothetical protein